MAQRSFLFTSGAWCISVGRFVFSRVIWGPFKDTIWPFLARFKLPPIAVLEERGVVWVHVSEMLEMAVKTGSGVATTFTNVDFRSTLVEREGQGQTMYFSAVGFQRTALGESFFTGFTLVRANTWDHKGNSDYRHRSEWKKQKLDTPFILNLVLNVYAYERQKYN